MGLNADSKTIQKARFFAEAKDLGVSDGHYLGDDFEEALERGECFIPMVGGKLVRDSKCPECGYKTHRQALEGANRFQESVRHALRIHEWGLVWSDPVH